MAFVLVQHLDPRHSSALVEILAHRATMPIEQVEDGTTVKPNHIYVIPPNATMSMENRVLRLRPRTTGELHTPIDTFFDSLARDRGSNAIGVVLSGSASDGTLGLK